jgi:two-component system chemotaxis sensor kinase CheA
MSSIEQQDLNEILATFLAETEEQFAEMEEALVALETHPDDSEAVQSIFRAAHTLKGNAASMGYSGVAEIAHALEDLLEGLRDHSVSVRPQVVTALLRAIDALRFLMPEIAAGRLESHPAQREIIDELIAASGALAPEASSTSTALDELSASVNTPTHRTLRVDLRRLDRMLDLSGEIAVAQGRLTQMLRDAGMANGVDALEAQRDANRIFMDLQEEILRARMVPLGPTFRQQIRTVRDAAQAASKIVGLDIEGEDVEVDTTLVEQLRGPLTHMVRNAVDHGIETPEVRVAKGKTERGRLTLVARHESGGVVIELRDDGAGLDRVRIAAKAKALGLVLNPEAMEDRDLDRLVFEPGFSTSETVTELSGRGIGMDVVRRNVEALRGSVDVRSTPGAGTVFSIRVPLTVAIIPGFLVEAGDETYVIPLEAVAECVDLPAVSGETGARSAVINLRGEAVPYLRLRQTFGLGAAPSTRESLVVVTHAGRRAAIAVDALLGESQVVIKPFSRLLRDLPGLAGSTILGSGRVALILDVPALLNSARTESQS